MNGQQADIATAFVSARREGTALAAFPGALPATLAEAYAIQDLAIAGSGLRPEGWKVAGVKPELRAQFGTERIAGPILRLFTADAPTEVPVIEVPVISGGFAAVEAEFAFRIGRDLPDLGRDYTLAELIDAIEAMHVAVEIAGSPFAGLSALGPLATVCDHGNNTAVLLGGAVTGWEKLALEELSATMSVNDAEVGAGTAAKLPAGGPLGSLAFLTRQLATRGRMLNAGDWVATGATTGVHPVQIGDRAVADFGRFGAIRLTCVPAR